MHTVETRFLGGETPSLPPKIYCLSYQILSPPNYLSTKTHPKRIYRASEKLLNLNKKKSCINFTYISDY